MLRFQCRIVLTCSCHPYEAYISNAMYAHRYGFAFGLVLMLRKLKLKTLLLDAGVTLRADERFYILSFSVIDTLLWSPGSDCRQAERVRKKRARPFFLALGCSVEKAWSASSRGTDVQECSVFLLCVCVCAHASVHIQSSRQKWWMWGCAFISYLQSPRLTVAFARSKKEI